MTVRAKLRTFTCIAVISLSCLAGWGQDITSTLGPGKSGAIVKRRASNSAPVDAAALAAPEEAFKCVGHRGGQRSRVDRRRIGSASFDNSAGLARSEC